MSQNCECNTNLTMLPVKGFALAVDASNLPGGSGCDCGPGNGEALDYSLEEQFTGKHWIDGKKIYQKTISIGTLPNKSSKRVPAGIENIDYIVSLTGFSYGSNPAGILGFPLPHIGTDSINYSISAYYWEGDVCVDTLSADRNTFHNSYVTLQYTCTDR